MDPMNPIHVWVFVLFLYCFLAIVIGITLTIKLYLIHHQLPDAKKLLKNMILWPSLAWRKDVW